MRSHGISQDIKPAKTRSRRVATQLHVVGGLDAGEVDLAEAWDSMLKGRFGSEQAFGQYLVQKSIVQLPPAPPTISARAPIAHQVRLSFDQRPIAQQQQIGVLLPKTP